MKKEVTIAILVGFIIGLIITFGIYSAQKAYNQSLTQPSPSPTPNQQETNTIPQTHSITLTSPDPESISPTESLTITGSTTADSFVTAVTNSTQSYTQADNMGLFELELDLSAGPNLILITSISPDNETAQYEFLVSYSTADFLQPDQPSTSSSNTNQE